MRTRRTLAVSLMTLALILVTIGAVNAQLINSNILNSWDDGKNRYENGNLTMWLNDLRQPFWAKLDFDTNAHADACGVGTSSQWAGDAIIGLYHVDNNPPGAPGFQDSGNWKLVKCSTFDTNKYPDPADVLADCLPGEQQDGSCVLIGTPDAVVTCAQPGGNCQDEIQTQFHVNIDAGDGVDPATKCDNTIDAPFTGIWSSNPQANNLCLYWDAKKPPLTTPIWGGNIQVRYSVVGGGDKTINFNQLKGPNAVNLRSLGAVAEANTGSLAMWAGAMALTAAALWLWRKQTNV